MGSVRRQTGSERRTLVRLVGDTKFRTVSERFGTASDTKYSGLVLQQGDQVVIRSAGGGGYGPPHERSPESLLEDLAEGFVSEAGRGEYCEPTESAAS